MSVLYQAAHLEKVMIKVFIELKAHIQNVTSVQDANFPTV